MLNSAANKMTNSWDTGERTGFATYVPSVLLLLIAIDNGWDILKVQAVVRWENYGPVYLLTMKCRSSRQEQKLIIPRSALVEKILEQHAPAMTPAC